MTSVTMWKARSIDEMTGREEIVQISEMKRESGSVDYNESRHKGNLCCAYCEAKVHFKKGSVASGGSSGAGRSSFFSTTRGEEHGDDCLWELSSPSQSPREIDPTRGYRIHINTRRFSEEFSERSGVYEVSKRGHVLRINEKGLKNREIYTVNGVQDLINLMLKGNAKRLKDSKVIFGNKAVNWLDFCMPMSEPDRWYKLTERALDAKKNGGYVFALMEIHNSKGEPYKFTEKKSINGQRIPFQMDEDGNERDIVPSISMIVGLHDHITLDLGDSGTYIVMGVVRPNTFQADNGHITEYLNVSVTDPRQIKAESMENIAAQIRAAKAPRRTAVQKAGGYDISSP